MIPDVTLYQLIKSCLVVLRADFAKNIPTPTKSILYHLLDSAKQTDTGKYNWYAQAVEIFISREDQHPKYLDARLFFDRERASIPTIHIMLNDENKGSDGINYDEGYITESVEGTTQRPILNRQFGINANIVITSDNAFETVIIYHVIKAMMISMYTHIQLLGFVNPSVMGGGDISLNQELAPNGIYARAINFMAAYELDVPAPVFETIGSSVWIQMKNINGQDITPVIGPENITGDTVITTEVTGL